jgi:hypothetical protein
MSPFAWFAITLTVAFIIYYTVMIMNDLYGKKPEEQNKAEEIDVPAYQGDQATVRDGPVTVNESEDGFSVGEAQYEAALPNEEPSVEDSTQTSWTPEPSTPTAAVALRNHTEALSEQIEPQFDDEYGAEEFRIALLNEDKQKVGRPKIVVKSVIDAL